MSIERCNPRFEYETGLTMEAHPEGECVWYDDHVAEVERLQARVRELEADPRLTLTEDDLSTYVRACSNVPEYHMPQAGRLRQRASKAEGIIAALAVSVETEDDDE